MDKFHLERTLRTPNSERWSVLQRNENGAITAVIAKVEVHIAPIEGAADHYNAGGFSVHGVVRFFDAVTDDDVRAVRDLLDGLYLFSDERKIDVDICTRWGLLRSGGEMRQLDSSNLYKRDRENDEYGLLPPGDADVEASGAEE